MRRSSVRQITLSFHPNTCKVEKNALASSPLTTRQNLYDTRTDRLDVLHTVMKLLYKYGVVSFQN